MHLSLILMRRLIVSLAAVALGCATAAAQQQPADLIVMNAKVATVDEQRPQATAFAVKDGKFVAVGDDAETARHRGEKTRVIDAKGHAVIPGLNDSHSHVVRE